MTGYRKSDSTTNRIRRAQSGDLEAIGPVVAQMNILLCEQARLRLGPHLESRVDPDDLVQAAWRIVLERLKELRPRTGHLGPVLFRFLATTILHQANSIARQVAREMAQGSLLDDAAASTSRELRKPRDAARAHPISTGLDSDMVRRVATALGALTAADRKLVVMRTLEGCSWNIIAQELGDTAEAARKRHGRLLLELRSLLRGTVFDEFDQS